MTRRLLNQPPPARVRLEPAHPGFPVEVNGEAIEALRESWLVEDRWWTPEPLRRRYWELLGGRGRNLVVFHDLTVRAAVGRGAWFVQDP
jgi:hypothetical protein